MMKIHETELRNIAPALCLILVAGLCFSASHATAAIIDKAQPDTALVYKTVGEAELKLHVFVPAQHKATDSAPAIVFFFGGGWNGGTRQNNSTNNPAISRKKESSASLPITESRSDMERVRSNASPMANLRFAGSDPMPMNWVSIPPKSLLQEVQQAATSRPVPESLKGMKNQAKTLPSVPLPMR